MATVVHFEIPTDDIERTKKFYGGLFGWKFESMPGPMEYWMFQTKNEKGEQTIGGGVMKRMHPGHTITNYIGVDSVDEYARKVEKLGGKVVRPKTEVPGYGWFVICVDTDKNTFALWESKEGAAH